MNDYLLASLGGFFLSSILNMVGVKNGNEGVEYYGEIHTSLWNCVVHMLFMPFTSYGIITWFPPLIGLRKFQTNKFKVYAYIMYISHYMTINFFVAFFVALLYLLPFYMSCDYTVENDRWKCIKHGLLYSTVALLIQEFFGHYLGGDNPSRFEAIPNAVLYAPYFSISGVFDKI